jgi:hypothetical protein
MDSHDSQDNKKKRLELNKEINELGDRLDEIEHEIIQESSIWRDLEIEYLELLAIFEKENPTQVNRSTPSQLTDTTQGAKTNKFNKPCHHGKNCWNQKWCKFQH